MCIFKKFDEAKMVNLLNRKKRPEIDQMFIFTDNALISSQNVTNRKKRSFLINYYRKYKALKLL